MPLISQISQISQREIPEGFHIHDNGGGLVADTASVAASVHIGANARVFDCAVVSDHAKVYGDAWVGGDAIVCDNAKVSGYVIVYDNAVVCDYAVISDHAKVYGDAVISGDINIINGIVRESELWGIYNLIKDSWIDWKNNRFDNIIGYNWNSIKNMSGEDLFAIPLIDSVPNFSVGIKLW